MRTMQYIKKAALVCCMLAGAAAQGFAQWNADKASVVVDWQMNAPLSSDFTQKISGWGMNFEAAYEVAPRWTVGAFASYHTNHKYVERQTLALSPTEALTTDQQRSAFQVPFGAMVNYTLFDGVYLRPYIGAKTGAMFSRNTTYYGASGVYDKAWGFYVSPEIGLKIHPTGKHWGFHLAGYYNYATNKSQTLTGDIDGQSNVGFRLGVVL